MALIVGPSQKSLKVTCWGAPRVCGDQSRKLCFPVCGLISGRQENEKKGVENTIETLAFGGDVCISDNTRRCGCLLAGMQWWAAKEGKVN